MKKAITLAALAAGFSFTALAADVTGYVIDEMCSKNVAMRGNVECANKCFKAGSPAVLVTEDGKIYKIADQDKVLKHGGHKVTITGDVKGDTLSVKTLKMS